MNDQIPLSRRRLWRYVAASYRSDVAFQLAMVVLAGLVAVWLLMQYGLWLADLASHHQPPDAAQSDYCDSVPDELFCY